MGLSPALGAFLAGVVLGGSPYAAQVRSDIGSLRILMVTLFFASVGMLAKPYWILAHIHWVLLTGGAVFVVKTIITATICRLFGLSGRYALAAGISLAQIGEFSLVLTVVARDGGLVTGDLFDLLIATTILLLFAAPYMVTTAMPATDWALSRLVRRRSVRAEDNADNHETMRGKVLVVGFGPAGQQVVNQLPALGLQPVVIDVNPKGQEQARRLDVPLHLGDAASEEILLHGGAAQACMAVVTVPDPATSLRVVETLRRLRPEIPIAVRCRYNRHLDRLRQAGVTILVDEETVVGRELAEVIADSLQTSSGSLLACRLAGRPDNHGDRVAADTGEMQNS